MRSCREGHASAPGANRGKGTAARRATLPGRAGWLTCLLVIAMLWQAAPVVAARPALSLVQGATFHPLGPARILDSRSGIGGASALRSDVPASFQISGLFGVPAEATAVTGTLTIASPSRAGFISLTAVATPAASISTSTLNFTTTDPRATGVTVPLGSDGKLWALYRTGRSGDTVQLAFDLSGYFSVDPAGGMEPLPTYFRGWLPNDAAPKDANGVVMADYGGSVGLQYNPLTVAQAAIGYYDRWQSSTTTDNQMEADRTAFFVQIDWLMHNQTADGRWLFHFNWGRQALPWWSGMAEGVAISAFLRAYSVTGDTAYLPAITAARTTFERSPQQGGVSTTVTVSGRKLVVYQEYMAGYNQNVLNGWLFAIVGLYEDAVYLGDPMAAYDVLAADRGVSAVISLLPLYDTGSWSYYNLNVFTGSNRGPLAKRSYHLIHIGQLRFLGAVMGDPVLVAYADRFQAYYDACSKKGTCPALSVGSEWPETDFPAGIASE
jgi:hypothetical protein